MRHFVVVYEKGGYGDTEFLAGIPDEWTDQVVLDLILWPMKDPSASYSSLEEVPAPAKGSPILYKWWKGGPAKD